MERLPLYPADNIKLQVRLTANKLGREGLRRKLESIEKHWSGGSGPGENGWEASDEELLWYELLKQAYDELPKSKETLGFDMDNERKVIAKELVEFKRQALSPAAFKYWFKKNMRNPA